MSKQAKALRQMERDALADDTDRLNEIFTKLKDSGALAVKTRRTGDDALSLPTESATVEQLPSTNSYDFLVFKKFITFLNAFIMEQMH